MATLSPVYAVTLTPVSVTPAGALTVPLMVAPLARVALMPLTSCSAATSTALAEAKVGALLYHWDKAPVLPAENCSL
ncbi:hypothetical protein D9M69_678850 [compost metagenome]